MLDLYNQITDLPPPRLNTPDPLEQAPPGKVRCACDKKFIPLEEIKFHQTGLLVASDTQCKECQPLCKDFALVVCLKCKAVVGKMAPKKFEGGFEMRPNFCYHVALCPTCRPQVQKSHVLEKYYYDKEQGYPVPPVDEVLGTKFPEQEVQVTREQL